MTAQETLHNLYAEGLGDVLRSLESERQQRVALLWKWGGGALLIGLASGGALFLKTQSWLGGAVALLLALIVWVCLVSHHGSRFAGAFKARVMPELVRSLGPELAYDGWDYLGLDEFRHCGLFMAPDRYHGCDLVSGYLGDTELRFSLVHAEEEYEVTDTETDSDGNTRTSTRTEYRDIFRGILFSADCNKEFSGATFVCAGGSGFLSRMRQGFVRLENPDFDRAFTVYGTDQVEARYLLTPSLMERILKLRERTGRGLQLSFVGGRLYLAVPMSLSSFHPSLWRKIDGLDQVAGYYGLLQLIIGIVEDLNLNTRIWSKRHDPARSGGKNN